MMLINQQLIVEDFSFTSKFTQQLGETCSCLLNEPKTNVNHWKMILLVHSHMSSHKRKTKLDKNSRKGIKWKRGSG